MVQKLTKHAYIIAPYTSYDEDEVRKRAQEQQRYEEIERYMAYLFNHGYTVVLSPVIHCRDLAERFAISTTYDFWQMYCEKSIEMLSAMDSMSNDSVEIHIFQLPGWDDSTGSRGEIKKCLKEGMCIFYCDPRSYEKELAEHDDLESWLLSVGG